MNVSPEIEKNVRDYLKKFTPEELYDSLWLFDMDFDNEPLENIIDAINSLRNDIEILAITILKAESNDTKVLRIGSKMPGAVYDGYSRKKGVLNKLIANKNIDTLLKTYLSTKNEQTSNKGTFRK